MPITLLTGLPGHGKTLYALARWKPEAEKAGRPVFHNSIPGLVIPGWRTWEVGEWEKLPAGALFIVDEAQFAFPVTGRGQTPEWVQKLATHRHLGIDFVVITQNPMLLDTFVRKLVDRHFHIVRKFGTSFATIHEFVNGAKEDVAKNRKDGIRHDFRYPKEVYAWYKSAELHTVKSRIPMRVFALAIIPIIIAFLCWRVWNRMKPDESPSVSQAATAAHAPGGLLPSPFKRSAPTGGAPAPAVAAKMTPAEYAEAHTPRFEGLAHTAPIYDGVTQPQQAPYPAACVASAKRCQCYSQQATKLDMADDLCRRLADGGFFVAWASNGDRVQGGQQQAQARPQQAGQESAPGYASLSPQAPHFAAVAIDEDAGSLPRRVRRAVQ